MVDNAHQMMSATRWRITVGCRLALVLVTAMVLMIAGITAYLVRVQMDDAAIISISGEQRMLSQRIILLTHDLAEATETERREILQELNADVVTMTNNHATMLNDANRADDYFGMSVDASRAIYYSPPLNLDYQVRSFLDNVHKVLLLAPKDISITNPAVTTVLRYTHGPMLASYTASVSLYEEESNQRFEWLYHVVITLSVVAVLIMFVIALLVLKPAIAYVGFAQKRLEELNQLKGDFLANMSHEIRTPMNGIFGMTELLGDSDLNERQQNYVRTLQNSADHLLGLINDILDFSKLEAGQMKLDPTRFNFFATTEDVLDLLASRARDKGLELLLRYLPGTPRFIVADAGRLRQVLFNLIGNAIKFTDTGYVMVHVEIAQSRSSRDNRPWLNILIEDTGIGISEDKIASLFEKFMQVESGSTRARQGTGLGLAICRNLAELMGGNIHVSSTPGKGTVFAFSCPLAGADEPQVSASHNASLAGKRILIVDDLAPNRLLYKEALTAAGIHCMIAENVKEAVSLLEYEYDSDRKVDAVMSDYVMPGGDGIELTRLIKAHAKFGALPVIILSSAGERGLAKRFSDAGAAACLSKPVAQQQLFDTIAHVLEAAQRGETLGIITQEASVSLNADRLLVRERPLYGTHILLAEDNRVNREITTEMLEGFGCKVSTAQNGEEAVEMIRREHFDLVFMDCQMPVMDGFEAAQHIVKLKSAGDIAPVPIVALTANAMKGDRERCLESGMDDYLSKPLRKANLEAILLKWLREKLEAVAAESSAPTQAREVKVEGKDELAAMPLAEDCGIDVSTFRVASDMLRGKLPLVASYYLQDAEGYVDRIAVALAKNDPMDVIASAHTLKSSSSQFGVSRLADYAARAESAARCISRGEKAEDISILLEGMQKALFTARPFFEALSSEVNA